jgi:hypothetical protein
VASPNRGTAGSASRLNPHALDAASPACDTPSVPAPPRVPRSLLAHSWTSVKLPDRPLADAVLAYAAPVLAALGPSPAIADVRAQLAAVVDLWNALQLASPRWNRRKPKALAALRTAQRGRQASPAARARFDMLTERWRREFDLDPRLVASWTYELDAHGQPRLTCAMALPDGVEADVPPPIERRVAIAGQFLDEVRIRLGPGQAVGFGVESHRGVVTADGGATVHAMMPAALQLFAAGHLPAVGGPPVTVAIGGRDLGPLVLAAVKCGGEGGRYDVAVLEFRPPARPR